MAWIHLLLFSVVAVNVYGQELIKNGGFESALSSEWFGHGFTMAVTSADRHGGHHALKVTGRRNNNAGPFQTVQLKSGTRYRLQAYAKQLNDAANKMFQSYTIKVIYPASHGGHQQSHRIVYHSTVRSADGWFSLIGYFQTPTQAIQSAQIHIQGPDGHIDFLLDDVSMTEISEDTHWQAAADTRIDTLRKGDIHVRVQLPSGMDPNSIEVQIDHKKHQFMFGSLVKDEYILDSQYKGYQDYVYDHFNIATQQSWKWKFDKGTQGHPDFTQALAALHELKAHGLEVRGHNMFWGFEKNLPTWVPQLSHDQLNDTVEERLRYLVSITKGQLIHWDIMNELIHGQWFEQQFHDPDYSEHLFREVHDLDPHPTLMLNDFSVISNDGDITDAYLQQAQKFLADGTPLQALGVQSHFHENVVPDPTLMKLRLDHIAQAGLPLWVTELSVLEQDPNLRADYYENVYRTYFSHPSVQGIVLWGFWDHHSMSPNSALVEGFGYISNEAGKRVEHLIQEEWSTHVSTHLSSGSNVDVRGFKGDYDVTIKQNGLPIKMTSFSLTGGEVTVDITLTGSEQSFKSTSPPSTSTSSPGASGSAATHVLGQATSSATWSDLHCTTRWSRVSEVGDDEHTQVSCHANEVLTGCSSILKNHDWRRDGEQILTHGGKPICMATDGFRSTQGIQAVAVCCKARDLSCTYRAAGPSQAGEKVQLGMDCASDEQTMGCSAWNYHSGVGGVMATDKSCEGFNNDPRAGVYVYGVCCKAPHLSCVTVTSSGSGHQQGDEAHVQCEAGYVMTGCNAVAIDGKSAGAYVSGTDNNNCQAFNGLDLAGGQQGVKAVARCCKISTGSGIIG